MEITQKDLDQLGAIKIDALQPSQLPLFVTRNEWDAAAIVRCGGTAATLATVRSDQYDSWRESNQKNIYLSSDARRGQYADGVGDDGLEGDYPDGIDKASDIDAPELSHLISEMQFSYRHPDSLSNYALSGLFETDMERWRHGGISTGFDRLDAILGHGMHEGLYVIAGGSSIGKTTFAWQLSNQLANSRDVLYFSLEMSRREMLLKTISGMTGIPTDRLNSPEITDAEREAVKDACQRINKRLNIVEAPFGFNVDQIIEKARRYKANTGNSPAIVVDYLQITKPSPTTKLTEIRLQLDEIAVALKKLSNELHSIVIVLSSVNRSSYNAPMTFEAIKESGGIEFTADAVFGLDLTITEYLARVGKERSGSMIETDANLNDYKRRRIAEEKAKTVRNITLRGLKNRNGVSNFEIDFTYNTTTNEFCQLSKELQDERRKNMIANGKIESNDDFWDNYEIPAEADAPKKKRSRKL